MYTWQQDKDLTVWSYINESKKMAAQVKMYGQNQYGILFVTAPNGTTLNPTTQYASLAEAMKAAASYTR